MRSEFDLNPDLIYLNSGTHAISPRVVLQAAAQYRLDYEKNPTRGLQTTWGRLWGIQEQLGDFFKADPRDLILRTNVTQLLNLFILGTPLRDGAEILTTDLEYGAITNVCEFRAKRDGRTLRKLHLPCSPQEWKDVTSQSLATQILAELRPDTGMLVLSHIMTGNGLILPIDEIARETRKRGILLIVDGAHAPGAMPLDFSKLEDVDYYAGNLHKWMMGPKGTAFGWVPKRRQKDLQAIEAGWTTFGTYGHHAEFGGGSRFASEFMLSGCYDFSSFFAIAETLSFWKTKGPEKIVARIFELQKYLENLLDDSALIKISPPYGALRGPLLSYDLPDSAQKREHQTMVDLLEKERLQIATTYVQGRWRLRVSPHVFNTEDELERAGNLIKRLSFSRFST